MPYETTVPVHRRLLWQAVTDAGRLVDALPGAAVEAAEGSGVAGRLRLRAQGQSVTFHGVARIVEVTASSFSVAIELEAAFGRGTGSVDGLVTITLRSAADGTLVVVRPRFEMTGELPWSAEELAAAGRRLVDRWFAGIAGGPATAAIGDPATDTEAGPDATEASDDQPDATEPGRTSGAEATAERVPLAAVPDLEAAGPEPDTAPQVRVQPLPPRPQAHHQAALRLVPQPADETDCDEGGRGDARRGDGASQDDSGPDDDAAPTVAAEGGGETGRVARGPWPAAVGDDEPGDGGASGSTHTGRVGRDERATGTPGNRIAAAATQAEEPEHDLWSRTPLATRISRWFPAAIAAGAVALVALGAAVRGRARRRRG